MCTTIQSPLGNCVDRIVHEHIDLAVEDVRLHNVYQSVVLDLRINIPDAVLLEVKIFVHATVPDMVIPSVNSTRRVLVSILFL